MSLSIVSTHLLKSEATTSLGSLFQCLTLFVKKFSLKLQLTPLLAQLEAISSYPCWEVQYRLLYKLQDSLSSTSDAEDPILLLGTSKSYAQNVTDAKGEQRQQSVWKKEAKKVEGWTQRDEKECYLWKEG